MLFKRDKAAKRSLFRKTVNIFIYTGVALIFLLIIVFAVSQTSTFREWLRDTVTEEFNNASNGKLYIEEIDGTLLTSLLLTNTSVTLDSDTIFSADKIEIKTSPLKLIFKIIYFRKIEITNSDISFLKGEDGSLNISKLFPPSEEPEDTSSSPFDWKFQVADLSLNNINFKLQTLNNRNSNKEYTQPDFDDLRIANLNLRLAGFADLSGNQFLLSVKEMAMKPNIEGFKLNRLSFNVNLVDDRTEINDLQIVTNRSDILINGSVSDFSFFDSNEKRNFENAVLGLDLEAKNFDFDDLSNWIPSTQLLYGKVKTEIAASGTLRELYLNKLKINYNNETELDGSGNLKDILAGAKMNINVTFLNSKVNQLDVDTLLRDIDIPVFPGYGILQMDTITFTGNPLNFSSKVLLKTDKGNLDIAAMLNLEKEDMEYDIEFSTNNFNLEPAAGLSTNLNASGSIKGKGTDPKTLAANIQIDNRSSSFGDYFLNQFTLICNASDGKINSKLAMVSDSLNGLVEAELNFENPDLPSYKFSGNINSLDLGKFIKSDGLNTRLNFNIDGEGEGFNPDEMNIFFSLKVDSSYLNDIYINSTRTIVDLRKDESNRVINIISDLADVTFEGQFNPQDLITLIVNKSKLIAASFSERIQSFSEVNKNISDEKKAADTLQFNLGLTSVNNLDVKYLVEFKDFDLISLFLGNADMEVDGEIDGSIKSLNNELNISMNTNLDYFKYWDGDNLFYTSGTKIIFGINDKTSSANIGSLTSDLHLESKRIFVGKELNDLRFDMKMQNEGLQIEFKSKMEDYASARFNGDIKFESDNLHLDLQQLFLNYKGFILKNKEDIDIAYRTDKITINNFQLTHNPGEIDIKGILSPVINQDLSLKVYNMNVKDLSSKLFGITQDKSPDAVLTLEAELKGPPDLPVMNANLTIDSVKFGKTAFGNFTGTANYSSGLLSTDLVFREFVSQSAEQKLKVTADIPLNLSLTGEKEIADKNIRANLKAEDFNIATLGSIVPKVRNLQGILNADIDVKESNNNIIANGNLKLEDVRFVTELNNLEYELQLESVIQNDRIDITEFTFNNSHTTQNGGTLSGGGFVVLNNLSPEHIEIYADGDLLMLNKNSRAALPNIYGDIKIRTNNNAEFKLVNGKSSLKADLILTRGTNLNILPLQSAFSNESDKIKYRIINMSGKSRPHDLEIDSLIVLAESGNKDSVKLHSAPIDLDLKIQIEDEAKLVLVLSREFNQNLTAYLGGDFQYTTINNIPQARGELDLMEGSNLEFIKTFEAEGSVKFFSDIDNPFLNITASYTNYYSPADTVQSSNGESEVLIQIKLEGPLKSLNTNLMKNEGNISVYIKRPNRGQFELDQTKTVSDAMMFIIVGKFADEATTQETNLAASTAVSLAGSVVGGVLNRAFGNVVRAFQLQQVGGTTKFNLIGRVNTFLGDVRYEVGGTSQVFQDFSRANVKLEYPTPFLPRLILRLERREPIYESSTYSEMINEVGIKYSFEF